MRRLFSLSLVALFSVLFSCASLSEKECRQGKWDELGFKDGNLGKVETVFDDYIKACSKHGVNPDKQTYMNSRVQGLKLYCTPSNAYQVGRSGRVLSPVCPGDKNELLIQNKRGLNIYSFESQIDRIESDIQDQEKLLSDDKISTLDKARIRSHISSLRFERDRMEREKSIEELKTPAPAEAPANF